MHRARKRVARVIVDCILDICYLLSRAADTYHYAVVACELVKAGSVSLTLVARTILLAAEVEDFEVVAINIVANNDIGEVFQECGLPTPISPARRMVYAA